MLFFTNLTRSSIFFMSLLFSLHLGFKAVVLKIKKKLFLGWNLLRTQAFQIFLSNSSFFSPPKQPNFTFFHFTFIVNNQNLFTFSINLSYSVFSFFDCSYFIRDALTAIINFLVIKIESDVWLLDCMWSKTILLTFSDSVVKLSSYILFLH